MTFTHGPRTDTISYSSDAGRTWTLATSPAKGSPPIPFVHGADVWLLETTAADFDQTLTTWTSVAAIDRTPP